MVEKQTLTWTTCTQTWPSYCSSALPLSSPFFNTVFLFMHSKIIQSILKAFIIIVIIIIIIIIIFTIVLTCVYKIVEISFTWNYNTLKWDDSILGWESQLLETGFLAIFLCPVVKMHQVPIHTPTPLVVIWGYRWLIFRIMIGAVSAL